MPIESAAAEPGWYGRPVQIRNAESARTSTKGRRMRKAPYLVVPVLFLCSQTVSAKTPAQLKADLAGIMPSGMKARMVWAQGTPSSYGSSNAQVYGVDSDDGQVKQITTGNLNADWPCLSADASRVFFYDNNSGEVKIVNWNGGTISILQAQHVSDGEVSMESWVDPGNKSDWVVIGRTSCGGEIGRINVDNPSQCVKLTEVVPKQWTRS